MRDGFVSRPSESEVDMKTIANIALGVCVGSIACWLVIHRRAVAATIKGEPLPEQPAWHPKHPCCK